MGFEGQKEGFASMSPKPAPSRSGAISPLMFLVHEIRNPKIETKYQMIVPAGASEVVTVTTIYETNVE